MNIGGMNHHRQQTTQHIYYDVPLSAFRFPPIYSAFFAGCYCFHTLGINDRVARALLASGI